MKTRFDLEQEIMNCWRVTDDVNILFENVMEKDLTTDQIANTLLGIEELYKMKFEKLFFTFEQLVKQQDLR